MRSTAAAIFLSFSSLTSWWADAQLRETIPTGCDKEALQIIKPIIQSYAQQVGNSLNKVFPHDEASRFCTVIAKKEGTDHWTVLTTCGNNPDVKRLSKVTTVTTLESIVWLLPESKTAWLLWIEYREQGGSSGKNEISLQCPSNQEKNIPIPPRVKSRIPLA